MRKIVVSNNFFNEAAKALKQGQTVKLLIGGHSMYPFIRGGIDLVEVVPSLLKKNCLLGVVLFTNGMENINP